MKALILAAGVASRLRPLTDHTPKCLLEVGGKCLLERAIDGLVQNGIRDVVIVTGYLQNQIEAFVTGRFPDLNVEYIHNERYAETNNIYSLWLAKEKVLTHSVLLLDSDIVFDPALVQLLLERPEGNCLALSVHPLGEEEMKVVADKHDCVAEISKTCSVSTAVGESIGIEKMSPVYVNSLYQELDEMILKEGLEKVFYEEAFQRLIQWGLTFRIVPTDGLFSMEIDTVEDFKKIKELKW